MAEFSTPTDGIPERDVKSRELDCSLSLRRRKGERRGDVAQRFSAIAR